MSARELSQRDLPTLVNVIQLEVEGRMKEEAERMNGKISDSRLWFELYSLEKRLVTLYHHAELIERIDGSDR